jgi:hypothetical protein
MVDPAHGDVDHWPNFGSQSTVDRGKEQWRVLTGVPMHGTSPRRRGKQEKGMGISTLVGTRRRRGSVSPAMVDRGGGQSSLMRGHSRCRGEERRGAVGAVWRCRDGGAFYSCGEARWSAKQRPEVHYQGADYSKGR